MNPPLKVLITGATGLVGYAAYTHLAGQPERYEVYGLDRQRQMSARTPGAWRNDIPDDRFHLCDLTDFDGIRAAVAGMDVVVHLAADPKGEGWESLRDNNLIGAYHIFEACTEAGVQRIVAASSITVSFGHRAMEPYKAMAERRHGDIPAHVQPVTVDVPATPRGLYAATKVWAESLGQVYAHQHNLSCILLRIGQVDRDWPRPPRGSDVFVSQRDVVGLIEACIQADQSVRFDIFYALSNNDMRWADMEHARQVLGFVPQDRAEDGFDYDAVAIQGK